MDRIKSFQIDHEKLEPGLYVSRVDSYDGCKVVTYDLRFTRPNREIAISQEAAHTIEHLGATFLRGEPEWKDKIAYFGPMGCETGFYLLLVGEYQKSEDEPTNELVCSLVIDMCQFIIDYDGDIPGASSKECGNFRLHNLKAAKARTKKYLKDLLTNKHFQYPS